MDKETALQFLERKMQLIGEQLPVEQQAGFERGKEWSLDVARDRRVTVRSMSPLEQPLEAMRMPEVGLDWEAIDRVLIAEFGVVRLGQDPMKICQRVLKRGKIRGDTEGEIIREFVANVGNEERIGMDAYAKLAYMLDEWETQGLGSES